MRSRIDIVYKVKVGSALYKKGIRWTEYMESKGIGKHAKQYMVLNHILTISMIIKFSFDKSTIDISYRCIEQGYPDVNHNHLTYLRCLVTPTSTTTAS